MSQIELWQFPAAFGLPCPSPFCTKAEILLKMAGVDYEDVRINDPRKGPKGKLPAVDFDGTIMGDSELIRYELERRTGIDFDAGLNETEKAIAHAMARMVEERLYWALIHSRWMVDETFAVVSKTFFGGMPPVIRQLIPAIAKRSVKKNLLGHGMGKHSHDDIMAFGVRDIRALGAQLGSKPWMMGDRPTSLDATAWPHLAGAAVPDFDKSPMWHAAHEDPRLLAYVERGMAEWFAA